MSGNQEKKRKMVRDVCRKIQCKIESAVGGSQHRYSQSALQFDDTEKLYKKIYI